MSMRLNAAMKQQVVAKAMYATFTHREKELDKENRALDKHIYMSAFADVKKYTDKLGKPWIHIGSKGETAKFNVAGRCVQISIEGLRVPSKFSWSGDYLAVLTDQLLATAVHDFYEKRDALKKERETATATLRAMLQNISTYERLEKEWPEGRKFYQSLPADFPFQHQVPAIEVKALNRMLGLAA